MTPLYSVGTWDPQLLLAARYLILAATGPEGGPTSWNETRDRWLALLDEHASVEGESRC